MSIRVMTRVWASSPSRGEALLVLLALADFADDNGVCWPKMATIAEKARITPRGARGVIADLEASGQLRRTVGRGRGHHNAYQVLTDNRNEVPISLEGKTGTTRQLNRNVATRKSERTGFDIRRNRTQPSLNRLRDVSKDTRTGYAVDYRGLLKRMPG